MSYDTISEADDANFLKFETRRDRITMCYTSEVPNNPITLRNNNITIIMSLKCHEIITECRDFVSSAVR